MAFPPLGSAPPTTTTLPLGRTAASLANDDIARDECPSMPDAHESASSDPLWSLRTAIRRCAAPIDDVYDFEPIASMWKSPYGMCLR